MINAAKTKIWKGGNDVKKVKKRNTERKEEKGWKRRERKGDGQEGTRWNNARGRERERDGSKGVEERRWSPAFRINTSTAALGVPSGSLFAPFPTLIPLSCFDVLPPRPFRSFSFPVSSSVLLRTHHLPSSSLSSHLF